MNFRPSFQATLLASFISIAPAVAEEAAVADPEKVEVEEEDTGTFTFVLENDLFFGLDRDYTNGIMLAWMSEPDHAPAWALRAARLLPFFPKDGLVRSTYAIGQNMYTPNDIQDPTRQMNGLMRAGSTGRSALLWKRVRNSLISFSSNSASLAPPPLASSRKPSFTR